MDEEVSEMFRTRIEGMNKRINLFNREKNVLKDLDLFVLDNSLRENAVGSTRGHSIENRWKIYNEVKKCGIKHIAVASFKHMTRTGELFLRELKDKGEDLNNHFAFVELVDSEEPKKGLRKCREHNLKNVVLELDLIYRGIDHTVNNAQKLCTLLSKRFKWIRDKLSRDSLILVNIRDFSECMQDYPARVLYLVNYLATLPKNERIFGITFEDEGKFYSEQLAVWTSCVREEMKKCEWDGHLLINLHEQYGMSTATQMDCLAYGATGVWAGLSEEGAAMGHISSCATIINLIRLGNKKVLEKFQCRWLAAASAAITCIITGRPPHPRQPVVGERALGVLISSPEVIDRDQVASLKFITDKSSLENIVRKLKVAYGENNIFHEDRARKMKEIMAKDANENRCEDYNSACGLAMLFDRSGGVLTPEMIDVINKNTLNKSQLDKLINEVRQTWDEWDLREVSKRNDMLDSFAFYNGFLAPYFGNSRSNEINRLLELLGVQKQGLVDWKRYLVHLKFAAAEHPDTSSAADLCSIAFRESLVIGMMDILITESDGAVQN